MPGPRLARLHRLRRPLIVAMALACLATGAGYWLLAGDLPGPDALITRRSPDATKIYDRTGRLLYEVLDPRAGRRSQVPLAALPARLKQAVIDVEDATFFQNPGVEPRGILRAAWQGLREGRIVSGGSTITQQLARELLLSQDERARRTVARKLREMILAVRMTGHYTKDQILELYLNEVYFGQLAYGIGAASQTYFGKPATELDLAESALLAGLIQSPARFNPLVDLDAATARQGVVLDLMAKAGHITQGDVRLARAEHLRLAGGGVPFEAPHFVAYVRNLVEARFGAEAVNHGGLHIVTSLDLDLQRRSEQILRRRIAELKVHEPGKPDYHASDAALVALDPATGQILAMVGSADYHDASIDGAVNVALALRQPGSAMKPLTYATAFDVNRWGRKPAEGGRLRAPNSEVAASEGDLAGAVSEGVLAGVNGEDVPAGVNGEDVPTAETAESAGSPWVRPNLPFTAATVLSDVPTTFLSAEGEPYRPRNYDREWHGPIPLRRALATSSNLVAVKVLAAVGVGALLDTAEALGITTLMDRDRYGLALTLGGGDVRLLELTGAYAGLAAGGLRVTPEPILRVMTSGEFEALGEGDRQAAALREIAVAGGKNRRPVRAISAEVAYLVTDILTDPEARLPAFGEGNVLELDRPAAAKTGTTTDFRDNWTIGYTPDLAVGVWVGNADNSPMQSITGITGAGPIWHAVMLEAHRGLPPRPFRRPPGLVDAVVCTPSGLLAGPDCQRQKRETFVRGTAPTAADDSYRAMALDAPSGLAWEDGCGGPRVRRTFHLLPVDALAWGESNGIPAPPDRTCRGNPVGTPDEVGIAAAGRTGESAVAASGQPGHAGEMTAAAHDSAVLPLQITQPAQHTTFSLSPQLPAAFQQIELAASPGGLRARRVTFRLNGTAVGVATTAPFRVMWPLAPGRFDLQAVAELQDGTIAESSIVHFGVLEGEPAVMPGAN